jgi:hypothetical protein
LGFISSAADFHPLHTLDNNTHKMAQAFASARFVADAGLMQKIGRDKAEEDAKRRNASEVSDKGKKADDESK